MICLPPKRFEQVDDPRFDPIRGREWFGKLVKRRDKIPLLVQALKAIENEQLTQAQASERFGVDERELRDYEKFVNNISSFNDLHKSEKIVYQHILDNAYDMYDRFRARDNFRSYIEGAVKVYGIDARPVWELWEVSPDFYPSGYQK